VLVRTCHSEAIAEESKVANLISPLLANIVLNRLDWHLEEQGYRFVRYADDFVVLTRTSVEAEKALTVADEFLTNQSRQIRFFTKPSFLTSNFKFDIVKKPLESD